MKPHRQRILDYDGVIHISEMSHHASPNQYGRWQARCQWVGGQIRGKHIVATCMECVCR